jgi:hypothetical protein
MSRYWFSFIALEPRRSAFWAARIFLERQKKELFEGSFWRQKSRGKYGEHLLEDV